MNLDPEQRFPTDLSDEAATTLCDFLNELALAADSHYFHQLRRYRKTQQAPPPDPNHPWQSTSPKP